MRKLPNANCVVQVNDARGFVVGGNDRRFVLTAAHCLPKLPPAHALSYLAERTHKNLLGPLGGRKTVWAECLFADPISDVAVLGPTPVRARLILGEGPAVRIRPPPAPSLT